MDAEPPRIDAELLFQQAACGLVLTREDGTILRVNDTFCTWVGYSSAELVGRRFQDFLSVGGKIFHQTHWLPLMRMQGSVREVKLDLLDRERRRCAVLVNGVRREHCGDSFHHLAIFETTDRDLYERELLKARKVAEEALQEKTAVEVALREAQAQLNVAYAQAQDRAHFAEQMVAIASHDLKTPLTAILMASQLLRRDVASPRQERLVGHIEESAGRADRLIRDLLDFTLIRVGHGLSVSVSEGDFHHVVGSCVDELRVAFPQANIQHNVLGPGKGTFDSDRLRQVVSNLVSNSVAYGDMTRPITLYSEGHAETFGLAVHNSGDPIPASILDTLFEPMARGTERGDARSVGLGLFIVREIAHAHGGDISVASSEGAGTTFTVRLAKQLPPLAGGRSNQSAPSAATP